MKAIKGGDNLLVAAAAAAAPEFKPSSARKDDCALAVPLSENTELADSTEEVEIDLLSPTATAALLFGK